VEFSNVKFSVDRKQRLSAKQYVIGRCWDEPIPIGSVFRVVYRREIRKVNDEFEVLPPVNIRTVALTVRGIDNYGLNLDMLGEGSTGRMWLEGAGFELLRAGDTLSTDEPGTLTG
jgi:hypothetical protein